MSSLSPPLPSSIAARRGREAPPLSTVKTSFDDSLLQISTPALNSSPGGPPKIAASPRLPPAHLAPQPRPALRQAKSFTNSKPSHKPSLFDLFTKSLKSDHHASKTAPEKHAPSVSRKSLGARPAPSLGDDDADELPSLPDHLKPTTFLKPTDNPLKEHDNARKESTTSAMDIAAALKDLEPPPIPTAPTQGNSWTAPPLFQVYPEALAHAVLEDPNQYRASRGSKRRATAATRATPSRPSTGYMRPTTSHRRPSEMTVDATPDDGIARKIYVLVTAGYVLEYASSGQRDRLPERTLQLGPSSAAFASDAIPGKHWVLQIVQSTDDAAPDVPLAPKKSIVKRIFNGPSSAPRRKPTKRLLLIFDDPSALNSWIVAVRNEVSRFSGKAPRPPTAIKKRSADADDPSNPELTVTSPIGVSSPTKPPSPVKATSPTHQMPSPPPPLPTSPTTLVGSERLSRADTAVGTNSNMSSNRSSRAVGKSAIDLQKVMANTISEQLPPEQTQEEGATEDDASQPPRSDDDRREFESMTTHSQASLSFDSSAGASHYSTDKSTPLNESDLGSDYPSPAQNFYTPMTTPMTFTFPREQKRLSTYTSASSSESTLHSAVPSPLNDQPIASPLVGSAPSRSTVATLRQSHSAPRLAMTSTPSPAMETIRETSSHYFSRRSPNPLPEDAEPPRSPLGNAFAEAAERREKSHSRQQSGNSATQTASNNTSGRTSVNPVKASPRSSPYGSQPGSKRTSIIHANGPLPLRTSQTYDSLGAKVARDSGGYDFGADLRGIQTKGESDSRESVLQQLSGTGSAGSDGVGKQTSPSAPRLRRPSSLRIKTDHTSFPSNVRAVQGPGSQMATPQSATEPSSSARSATSSGPRSSTLVPVVRPPIARPARSSRRIGSSSTAPPSAPPNVPLPSPPRQLQLDRTAI